MAILVSSLCVSVYARTGGKGRLPVLGWNTWCTQNKCTVDWCSSDGALPPSGRVLCLDAIVGICACLALFVALVWMGMPCEVLTASNLAAEVLSVAQYINSSGLQAAGYDHINLDDVSVLIHGRRRLFLANDWIAVLGQAQRCHAPN